MRKLYSYQAIQGAQRRIVRILLVGLICLGIQAPATAVSIDLKTADYDPACGIAITQQEQQIVVSWQMAPGRHGQLVFDLNDNQPLIQSTAVSTGPAESFRVLAKSLDPIVMLRVGERDLAKRDGWTIFFDRMQRKPHKLFVGAMKRKEAIASSTARRATLRIGDFTAGPFHGYLQWTFYAGNPFVLQEAVLQTDQDGVAYLYDMGLVCRAT